MDKIKVALGSDHAGCQLKEEMKSLLKEMGLDFEDFGTQAGESVDYPDIAEVVAAQVTEGKCQRGILICGTGIGISIAANKVKGIRAALCHDVFSAKMSRAHNDANILAMGERVIGPGLARMIAETWLKSEFEGDRHTRRVCKIANLER